MAKKRTTNHAANLCQLLASNYHGKKVAMRELSKNKRAKLLAHLAISWAKQPDDDMAVVFAEAESMLRSGWKLRDRDDY